MGIDVHKTGEHYDAIVPETRPISGNDRINVALAANDKDTVKSSPGFGNFIDIGMCTGDSNSLHSYAMINFRNFIDIYEYLDDEYELPTSKLINDDVDKTPVADMNFLDQLVKFRNQYPKKISYLDI